MARATLGEVRPPMTFQVGRRGIEPVGDFRDLALDKILLIERTNAKRNICLSAGEIETSWIIDQVDGHLSVARAEACKQWCNDVITEPRQTGHRDLAL